MSLLKTLLILVVFNINHILDTDAAFIPSFPIGGLFNSETLSISREAFENIGQVSTSSAVHGRIIYPTVNDSYSSALEVCDDTSDNHGIVALIDARPTNGICDYTCLLCNRLNISHLLLGWEPTETLSKDLFTFSYYPPPELISKAYATLIKDLAWGKFTILYEDEGSFIRLQEIINSWPLNKDPIIFRKLDPNGDNREVFKDIFKVARINHHIIDCDINNVVQYMEQIMNIENSTQYLSFILTNLDSHTINLNSVPNFMANVSTMHFTIPNDVRWNDISIPSEDIRMETALAADALNHLEKAVRAMESMIQELRDRDEDRFVGPQLRDYGNIPPLCFQETKAEYEAWPYGDFLREALIQTTIYGFTGNVQFDETGKRKNFQMNYSKLSGQGTFMYAGNWDPKTDIITKEDKVQDRSTSQTKATIRVTSRVELPYFTVYNDSNGQEAVRGYAVDLIHAIFKVINDSGYEFQPVFHKVPDNKYGNPIEGTNKWDGLIGALLALDADLAVCDLSISSERSRVVDFSNPFMTTGISMLFAKREPEPPDMFSFIKPLGLDVWLYLAITYVIVSFILLICARMSQDDWVNPHPCNQDPEYLQNIWSLYNCMWLTMGTIMTQGCDILPRGFGSRWITGMWWFFAMIITASYTANMSAFLSSSRRTTDITNVNDLADQTAIRYGAVINASTYRFFETSNETLYAKIWSVMSSARPTVFTTNNVAGKDNVLQSKGNYAFFMESAAIKYFTARECQLKMVGDELDSKGYGIAMPKNFPYKDLVNEALLKLQESQILEELRTKWWKQEDNEAQCEEEEAATDDSLQMENTGGIFLVLGAGGILGLFVAIIDFLLNVQQISVKEKVTFKEAFISEWRASLNPRQLHKAVAPPRSAAASESPSQPVRSRSRAVSVLKAATSFINFDEIY